MQISLVWVGILLGGLSGLAVSYLCDGLVASRRVAADAMDDQSLEDHTEGWRGFATFFKGILNSLAYLNRPHCHQCGAVQSFGNFFLWRSCQMCGAKRPWRDFIILVVYLLLGGILWLIPSRHLAFVPGLVLLIFLGVIFVMDIEHRVVLEEVSLAGAILGVIIGIWLHGLLMTIAGGLAGFGIMFAFYKLGEVYARWMAKRRGEVFDDVALGFGDVNVSGIIGLLLGWPGVILGLLAGIFLGGAFSLLYMVGAFLIKKYRTFMAIPYAPFLVLGVFLFLYIL